MRGLRVGTAPIAITFVLWFGGASSLPTLLLSQGYGAQAVRSPLSVPRPPTSDPGFTNIARDAGLDMTTVFGGREKNNFLLETTGTGVAMLDYDGDGWLDLFFVNGSTFEGFAPGAEPTNHLYRNRGNRTFEDVTAQAGLAAGGWGQGACVGDYDNDGHDDLFVTYWGQNRLYHNDGRGHFIERADAAGLRSPGRKWSTGCAFLDYDRDGRLDLFAASYIDFDPATTPRPESGLCRYRGLPVACGPPGLPGGRNALYRNRGDGTFEDVSDSRGHDARFGNLRVGRQHHRLRRRRLGRPLRRGRFQSERSVSQQS